MAASPQSPYSPISRDAVRLIAFLGADDGSAPATVSEAAPWLLAMDLQHNSGASPSTMTFQVDLDRLDSRYQDIDVPVAVDRTVELRALVNGSVDTLMGWGKLATNEIAAGRDRESSAVTTRLDSTALELKPLQSQPFYDGESAAQVDVAADWTFNPAYQSVVIGNRSTQVDGNGAYYFLARGSVATEQSLTLQTQQPKRWTLAQAVHALCWACNPDETRLTNPTLAELQAVLDDAERDAQFREHTIPLGTDLFAALDSLLRRYSCSWHLHWEGGLGSVLTTLRVFELGQGLEQPVRMQRIEDTIDAAETDVDDLQLNFDITAQPNRIHAASGREQREITLKLYPAWDPDNDPAGASNGYLDEYDELAKNPDYQPGGKYAEVGRKWAANEAGDYKGFRTSQATEQVIADTTRRVRRPLLPCLTRDRSGDLVGDRGFYLQWKDFDDEWHEEPDAFHVLDDEAGIIYSRQPPIEVWNEYLARGDSYFIRITSTVEIDTRVEYQTSRRTDSPQGKDHWLYLSLGQRFSEKRLLGTGDQASIFYASRKFTLQSVTQNSAGDWLLILDRTPVDVLQVGQKIAVLDSDRENVYTVKEILLDIVTVNEDASAIDGSTASDGLVFANTDAEGSSERLQSYATRVRDDNDYALVSPTLRLAGVDHPQYEIGQLVPAAQPRNVSFAGRRGGERAPQIVALAHNFHGKQETTLQLEQIREVQR